MGKLKASEILVGKNTRDIEERIPRFRIFHYEECSIAEILFECRPHGFRNCPKEFFENRKEFVNDQRFLLRTILIILEHVESKRTLHACRVKIDDVAFPLRWYDRKNLQNV